MTQSTGVNAHERWDNEGGSQLASLAKSFAIEEYEESERRILAFLGASILSLWDELPLDARQQVLNRQSAQAAFTKSALKAKIARLATGDLF
ncbi:MAG: hypothetical protein ACN6O5_15340 [Achromobacter sp.]|uniref:hypothetical protein n=1 Tax=unclassified Achromobacter TaxID=2626865 RepID=UPI0009EB013E|nr:hypothetical protein [Achromobacter sp. Root565]